MEFTTSVFLGIGLIFATALIFGGVLIARLSTGSRVPTATVVTTQPAVPGASPTAQQAASPKFTWVTNKWALLIEIPLVLMFLYYGHQFVNQSKLGAEFWLTGMLVVILAVAGALGKGGVVGKVALGILGTIILGTFVFTYVFREDAPMVGEKLRVEAMTAVLKNGPKETTSTRQQPVESPKNVRQMEAQWKVLQPDGTIPVNTESETVKTPVYCNIRYPDGYGETYVAQYDTRGQGWATMEPNKHYEAKNIRLKVLVPGIRSLTYTLVCR